MNDTDRPANGSDNATSQSNAGGGDPALRPRDAATLVLVDTASGVPKVLMGRRRAGQVFMPSKVVFPGGRVDEADKLVRSGDALARSETEKLLIEMKGRPSEVRARALALAAIRETFEETGVIVGRTSTAKAPRSTDLPPAWRAFHDAGFEPLLSELCFFARAITPPGRPRRYDTRFFCASANLIAAETGASDQELDRIGWFSLEDTKGLDLPPITRVILEDLVDRLDAGPLGPLPHPVPFYHHRQGSFLREFLGDDR
jgi:8-oxo-dGTP pyrophosphatase MutT (NUDIX family)